MGLVEPDLVGLGRMKHGSLLGEKPTLREIARLTGTTPNTVSRALNDKDGVSKEMRALIKQAD